MKMTEAAKHVDSGSEDSGSEDNQDMPAIQPVRKRKKRTAPDESLLEEDEKVKLEQRRAYNRACAAKARKRSKDLISTLQKQVEDLTRDKAQLERTNDVMRAQLELLEQQNRTLMSTQRGVPQQMQPQMMQQHQMGMHPIYITSSGAPAYTTQGGHHYIEVQPHQPNGVPAGAIPVTHMARTNTQQQS
jgi:hypothetical protein